MTRPIIPDREIWANNAQDLAKPSNEKFAVGNEGINTQADPNLREPPKAAHHNYLSKRCDETLQYYLRQGIAIWHEEEVYPQHALCMHQGHLYQSLEDNNTGSTPSDLIKWIEYLPQASETKAGKIEIATQAEVDAGTDHKQAVSPKTLKATMNSFPQATETVKGKAEVATQAEADAASDHSRVITPKTLKATTTPNIGNVTSTATSGSFNVTSGNTGIVVIGMNYSHRAAYGGMGTSTFSVTCNSLTKTCTSHTNEYENRRSAADMTVFLITKIAANTQITCSWTTTGTKEVRNMNGFWMGL